LRTGRGLRESIRQAKATRGDRIRGVVFWGERWREFQVFPDPTPGSGEARGAVPA